MKRDLALNNLQSLICHKTLQTNQPKISHSSTLETTQWKIPIEAGKRHGRSTCRRYHCSVISALKRGILCLTLTSYDHQVPDIFCFVLFV